MKRRLEQPEETPRTTPDMTCRKHNRELSVFCRTDQTVMCAVCASMEHRGHTLGLVCEERRVKQENLQNMLVKSQGILQGHKQTCMNKRKIIKRIQVKAREAEDFCEAVLVRVMDSLQKHLVSVRERIKIQEKAAVAEVDVSIQGIQLRMKKTMLRKAELEVLVQSESDVDFLQKWTTLQLAPEPERESQQDPEDPDLLFEPIKGALEQLGRKMEELADGFAPVSLPDDEEDDEEEESEDEESEDEESEDEESEDETDEDDEEQRSFSGLDSNIVTSEPRTRAEFLTYACRLTFDSSTAYPDLLVSSDGREVRHCSQGANSPSTRHPGRFVHRRQLLCRDPLLAECSYYEVEVEGSKAEIALAYHSMDRKSRTSVSAFGANASSWSLDRSTFYSVSHRADSVQLTTAPCQRRVGVLVKHREGVVSFYEVTETMTMVFLYRLEAEFTEPVYPGFWLGEKCRISICDLH